MGKQNLAQKDLYERINYLYQAARTMLEHNTKQPQVSCFYGHVLSNVAARGVLKLDPSIKRTICKACNAVLIPGLTSSVRIRGKRQKHLVITCIQCKTLKRFVCNSKHKLWSEQGIATCETTPARNPEKPLANEPSNL